MNRRTVGCVAVAQEMYGVTIHSFVALSTHIHVLATYEDAEQMARFHCHLNGNLSKEVSHVHDWKGTVFPNPYTHVELSPEPQVELARLKYHLAQGCKEGLVASPLDWPGASSTEALVSGEMAVLGEWINRTKLSKARDRGERVSEEDFAEEVWVRLDPLPGLAHLSRDAYAKVVLGIVREIEEETAAMHRVDGTRPLGVAAILARDPCHEPAEVKSSPRPWFFALDPEMKEAMANALIWISVQYRKATELLKSKDPAERRNAMALFPPGTFPPGLPFVREVEILEPG